MVLAYSHLEDFFSSADIPTAREALRQWLWEQPEAMKTAAALSPEGKHELDLLLHHRDQLRDPLLREITLHKNEMESVSPHAHLVQLHTPVFLLHGAGDTVIPASETLWLAKDVPAAELRASLVSAALVHVDMGNKVTWQQQWQLVDFMAQVLDATETLGFTFIGDKMSTKIKLKAADGHEFEAYFAESSGPARGAIVWSRKSLASTATFAPLPMTMRVRVITLLLQHYLIACSRTLNLVITRLIPRKA